MSDNEDQGFQDLGQEYQNILDNQNDYKPPNSKHPHKYGEYSNPVSTQSTIRYRKNFHQQIYKVKIQSGENLVDIKILQSQFYLLKLYQKDKIIKENIRRRYSDFDLLFQLLEKRYPGYLFPAFPEKGILSYVKTKVIVAKDDKLLKTRMKMIQRFLNNIINDQKFNPQKCMEIRKFFSPDSEFELFKKTAKQEISRDKSIVDSTWGIIKDFFKMSQTTKYSTMIEQIKKDKVPFEEILSKTQEFLALITDELEANSALCDMGSKDEKKMVRFVPAFTNLKKMVANSSSQLNPVSVELNELEINLQCENQDYLMALKKIEVIEQMKESEQNYKNLAAIENEFSQKLNELRIIKKQKIQKLKQIFRDILERIIEVEREKQ